MKLTPWRVTRRRGLRVSTTRLKRRSALSRVQKRSTHRAMAATVLPVRTGLRSRCFATKGRNLKGPRPTGGGRRALPGRGHDDVAEADLAVVALEHQRPGLSFEGVLGATGDPFH